jgi:uncharacterized protein YacL (UPF0231 family)
MTKDQSHLQSHQAWKDWAHQAWEKEGTPHQAISAWLDEKDQSHLQSHQAWKDWAHQAWEKEGTPHQAISAWLDEQKIRVICNPIKLERTEPIKLERKKELLIKPSLLG